MEILLKIELDFLYSCTYANFNGIDMEIEEVLLEYFNATNRNSTYTITRAETLPNPPQVTTSVVLNGRHVSFWEVSEQSEESYTIYWLFAQGDSFDYLGL